MITLSRGKREGKAGRQPASVYVYKTIALSRKESEEKICNVGIASHLGQYSEEGMGEWSEPAKRKRC